MGVYVDSFILPVPKSKLKDYKKLAALSGKVWMEYGALSYVECIEDDVKPGKVTSFPQSVKLKKDEVVIFSYATYKSRKDRDKIMKAVMKDPRMVKAFVGKKMPFDGMRMFWGGFKPFLSL